MPAAKNLTGQIIGRLTIIKRAESEKKGQVYWLCQCECGNEIIRTTKYLREAKVASCGCYTKTKARENLDTTSLIGKVFGDFVAVKRDLSSDKNIKNVAWILKCQKCGLEKSTPKGHLWKYKDNKCKCQWDIPIGTRFGKLTILGRNDELSNSKKKYWNCQCDCGKIIPVLRQQLTRTDGAQVSCGCEISKGELIIRRILEENKINFQQQQCFPDLKDKGSLRYDFSIKNDKNEIIRLIEYDGPQHTRKDTKFHTDILELHDKMKNEYAEAHNIPLVRISYKDIDNITLKMLLGG